MKHLFFFSISLSLLIFNFSIGQERIANGDFEKGKTSWAVELHETATATFDIDTTKEMHGKSSAHITITNSDGTDWHLQFQQIIGAISAGKRYRIEYEACASEPVAISAWIQQYHDSYSYYYQKSINLTEDNQTFLDSVDISTSDSNVKFAFAVGALNTGDEVWFDTVSIVQSTITSVELNQSRNLPNKFNLMQNYPNPFNPTTTIEFSIPEQSNIQLTVVNMLGQFVKEIANGDYTAGTHKIILDASKLSTGVYFYKLQAGRFTDIKKLVLIK